MKKQKLSIRHILSITFILITITGFILLFLQKDNLTNYASELSQDLHQNKLTPAERNQIAKEFDYSQKDGSYEITFLELGSTGCVSCKKMETVMEEIENLYPRTVNVVFHNITKEESKKYAVYYGVVAIPTQILLDKTGVEFFRHVGYISTEELKQLINEKL